MENSVVIFGDCVIQQSCEQLKHYAAFGLTNWLSIVSPISDRFAKISDQVINEQQFTDYEKRVWRLNANKNVFKFLFNKKADYFIFDCNDNRKEVLVDLASKELAILTPNLYMNGSRPLVSKIFDTEYSYSIKQCYNIDFHYYENAVDIICSEILKHYNVNEIIYLRHKPVECYFDDQGIHRFVVHPNDEFLNFECRNYLDKIESIVLQKMPGIHIIDFPENVIVDRNHRFGLNPMHYYQLYYEYAQKALNIIFSRYNTNLELQLLDNLKEIYSLKFENFVNKLKADSANKKLSEQIFLTNRVFQNIIGCENNIGTYSSPLKNIFNFDNYLDYLYEIRHNIIVIVSVKDTAGFYTNCETLNRLKRIGFNNYPQVLWSTYLGVCLNGKIILDIAGKTRDEDQSITLNKIIEISNLTIYLESSPYNLKNSSKIVVNGIDYSKNERGINIVILDSVSNVVVDSVSYDSHANDFFRRM